jgi:hypothetical protein
MKDERSRYVRMWALFLSLSAGLGTAQTTKTVNGFVTQIGSPTDFALGALHIVIDGKTQCATQILDSDIQLKNQAHAAIHLRPRSYLALQSRPDPKSVQPASCDKLRLTIGSHVQIVGNSKQGNSSLSATQVTLYSVSIRQTFSTWPKQRGWESAALLEEAPQVGETAQGWAGTMWLDGYPMSVTPTTALVTAPSGTQISYRQFGPFLVNFSAPRLDAVLPQSPSPPFSPTLFQPNTWATYQSGMGSEHDVLYLLDLFNPLAFMPNSLGRKTAPMTGRIPLDQIRLWPNHVDKAENKYWEQLTPTIHAPDYQNHIWGSVQFPHAHADKILPDQAVQDYVSNLGISLIPQYQKALPEMDATKIHFRFYVFRPVGTTFNDDFAVASPTGLILIPERTLTRIDNEAQLASILSYSITSVLQKHTYIEQHARPDFGFNPDFEDNSRLVFTISMDEQALRIGIREMYLAGYDIREAPYAWAAVDGKHLVNPAMDPKYPNDDVPRDTAYAFNYLSQFYSDVDYGKLKKGEAEYSQFLDELRKADPQAFANP